MFFVHRGQKSYKAQAGSTMLISSVAFWVIIPWLLITILISTHFTSMNKTEHYCHILSYIYQNNNKMGSGFPPTSPNFRLF